MLLFEGEMQSQGKESEGREQRGTIWFDSLHQSDGYTTKGTPFLPRSAGGSQSLGDLSGQGCLLEPVSSVRCQHSPWGKEKEDTCAAPTWGGSGHGLQVAAKAGTLPTNK